MPTILTKRSSTAGAVPISSQLTAGETAVNTADAYMYVKHTDGSVKRIGTTANNVNVTAAGVIPDGSLQDALEVIAEGLVSSDTGRLAYFMRSTAPAGYIKANGLTIGAAGSGATNRANADTQALFELLWTEFDNTLLHIQDSTGAPTTRGASAAADWAANKRLPVFDLRGKFGRGWDDGRGLDAGRGLGTDQSYETASHAHAGSSDSTGSHTHGITDTGHAHAYSQTSAGTAGGAEGGSRDSVGAFSSTTGSSSTGISIASGGSHSHAITVGATGGSETRPTNVSVLVCITL